MNEETPTFCGTCGNRTKQGQRFCGDCGAPVGAVTPDREPDVIPGGSDYDADVTSVPARPAAGPPAPTQPEPVQPEPADDEAVARLPVAHLDQRIEAGGEDPDVASGEPARPVYVIAPAPAASRPFTGPHPGSGKFYLLGLLGVVGGLIGYLVLKDRDRATGTRVLITGAVVSLAWIVLGFAIPAIFFAGVGKSIVEGAEESYSSGGGTYEYDTPSPTPSASGTYISFPSSAWTWSATAPSGYTMSLTLAVERPYQVSESPYVSYSTGDLMGGETCLLDSETDALVPFDLGSTNTTPQFSATTGVLFTWNADMEVLFTSGAQCRDANESTESYRVNSSGEESSTKGFLIVEDYYSPAFPQGDPSKLMSLELTISTTATVGETSSETTWTMAPPGISGPNVSSSGYGSNALTNVVRPFASGAVPGA